MYGKIPNLPQIEYGRLNEPIALTSYAQLTGLHVKPCGLFVSLDENKGFLAASPDGLVGDNKIVEIKCPYSGRALTPHEIPARNRNFCCTFENDKLKLKRKHNYYYQVQGQLYVTQRQYCDFVIWTPKGISIETIEADKTFISNMVQKLELFYYKHYGPDLVDSRHSLNLVLRDTQ